MSAARSGLTKTNQSRPERLSDLPEADHRLPEGLLGPRQARKVSRRGMERSPCGEEEKASS